MFDPQIYEIGVGGLLAYLIIKLVLDFVVVRAKSTNLDCNRLAQTIENLEAAIRDNTKAIDELRSESKLNQQALSILAKDVRDIRIREARPI